MYRPTRLSEEELKQARQGLQFLECRDYPEASVILERVLDEYQDFAKEEMGYPPNVDQKAMEKLINWRSNSMDQCGSEAYSKLMHFLPDHYGPGQSLEKPPSWEHHEALKVFQSLKYEDQADIVGFHIGYDWREELERMEDEYNRRYY